MKRSIKNTGKAFCFLSAIALMAFIKAPNKTTSSYVKEVREIFDKMYSDISGNKDKVSYINYEVISRSRAKGKLEPEAISRSDIKIYSCATSNWFVSEQVCMYQDKKNTFTVIPSRKVIYWADSNMGIDKKDRVAQMKKMQDTLFLACEKAESLPSTAAGTDKLIRMTPTKKWSELLQIKTVSYFIDSKKKEIKKQVIEYGDYKKLRSVEYIYKENKYDYKDVDMSVPVKELFFETKSKLKDRYKGYQLIDVRKNK